MSDVFISYSRKDGDFVRQLSDDLKARQREAWVDWQGIDYSTHWWEEICAGIDGADNFVIILSMNSLNSRYCHQEIEYARQSSKRFIPILYEPIDEVKLIGDWYTDPDIHPIEALARENWEALKQIQFINRSKLDGDQLVKALLHTVDTDVERVQIHTRLLLRIQDWEKRGRTPSALLRGDELISHEAWRDKSLAAGDEPRPTQAQIDYIAESRRVEDADRAEQAAQLQKLNDATARAKQSAEEATIQQRRARQRTQIALGVIALAVVVGILSATLIATAQQQTTLANKNADNAQNTVVAANATLTPIPMTLAAGAVELAAANVQIDQAGTQVNHANTQIAAANMTLTQVPPTLTFVARQSNSLVGLVNAVESFLNRPDLAIAAVSKVIASDPTFELSYKLRGLLYKNQGILDKALADYTKAIALNPQDSDNFNNRANVYYAQQQNDQALADYDQALTLDPKFSQAYNNRGNIYYVQKQYDKALADFNQAIALDPNYANAYNDRANVYYVQGQYDKAITDYTQALTLDPKDANAYYGRGLGYRKLGQYDKALADFLDYKHLNGNTNADQLIADLQAILTATGAPPATITPIA